MIKSLKSSDSMFYLEELFFKVAQKGRKFLGNF